MIGGKISHYEILKKIGEGGMGEVYLAEDVNLHRKVAIKVLAARYTSDADFKARFLREARATAALSHPNIVTIHEVDEEQAMYYIVMEYVDGESLKELIRREPLPVARVIEIARQIGDGLGAAHRAGVVHRDIKPGNILLNKAGQVKIVDFGLAKLQGATGLTRDGMSMGTPHYMSPEQIKGEATDHRSDIFAFGVVLSEMLTRQLPFKGETTPVVIYAIINKAPEPAIKHNPAVTKGLQKIINRALEKNPKARYQQMEDCVQDLMKEKHALLLAEQATKTMAIGESTVKKLRREKKWRPVLIAATALVLLALVIWFILDWRQGKSSLATLSITSAPVGAAVFLNGDSLGLTPLRAPVDKEGSISLRFRQRDYFPLDTTFAVKKGVTYNFTAALRPAARVAIMVDPSDSEVRIDGEIVEPSQLAALQLPVGEHSISLARMGYDSKQERFSLQQGDNPSRRYALAKQPGVEPPITALGVVQIDSQPPDAEVVLDGRRVGSTPYQGKNLKPGRYTILVSKDGFETYSGSIEIRPGQTTPLLVSLKAVISAGQISVTSDPEGATILLDGREAGTTPQELTNIPAGGHEIVLRKKGYKDYAASVTVAPQQTQNVVANLVRLMGRLQVLIKPYGTIYLDGSLQIRDTNVRFTKELPVGSYELKVTHPSYGVYFKILNIEANAPLDILVDFNRQLTLPVTSTDETGEKFVWGEIYVDGKAQGQTPRPLTLRLGQHTIEVRREGYTSLDKPMTINLEEDRGQPLKFRLKKKE
ncbi:MAG: PEGA domain-containing protein [candidate division KSB1 bacterium]|nr:PEGA domain-containing protein [candidate division KSB1 bacterium]MDZ7365390.1 PEGA domain-containing protein [candidate division KSB1 bacterium]MDZ7403563.1 PEGA domain-containing protein [candidate division KSB1 bacterium]